MTQIEFEIQFRPKGSKTPWKATRGTQPTSRAGADAALKQLRESFAMHDYRIKIMTITTEFIA